MISLLKSTHGLQRGMLVAGLALAGLGQHQQQPKQPEQRGGHAHHAPS